MHILEIENLSKSYGKIKALSNVSFTIPEGAIFGLLGPNGSGKTTLLSIILGVLNADAGAYSWFGEKASANLRKRIGSLLETPNFYHYLSGKKNLAITQSISGRGNAADIETALQEVNLQERKNYKFSSYSLGMKQRLAIGAALLGSPKIIVLDEPTNGLDPVGIAEIRELIKGLSQKGHTIIMASHLLDEVEKVCTHVAILKKGTLITYGTVEDVLIDEDVIEIAAENLTALIEVAKTINGCTKIIPTPTTLQLHFVKGNANATELNAFYHSKGIVLSHLSIKRKRLEEKFFELTSN